MLTHQRGPYLWNAHSGHLLCTATDCVFGIMPGTDTHLGSHPRSAVAATVTVAAAAAVVAAAAASVLRGTLLPRNRLGQRLCLDLKTAARQDMEQALSSKHGIINREEEQLIHFHQRQHEAYTAVCEKGFQKFLVNLDLLASALLDKACLGHRLIPTVDLPRRWIGFPVGKSHDRGVHALLGQSGACKLASLVLSVLARAGGPGCTSWFCHSGKTSGIMHCEYSFGWSDESHLGRDKSQPLGTSAFDET